MWCTAKLPLLLRAVAGTLLPQMLERLEAQVGVVIDGGHDILGRIRCQWLPSYRAKVRDGLVVQRRGEKEPGWM